MLKRASRLKIIFLMILSSMLMFLFSTGCTKNKEETFGDFVIIERENVITLVGLSEAGKIKKEIIVPSHINGKPVTGAGVQYYFSSYSHLSSDNMETLYFPYTLNFMIKMSYIWGKNLKKVCYPSESLCEYGNLSSYLAGGEKGLLAFGDSDNYVTPNGYEMINEKERELVTKELIKKANVLYRFNYADAPNGGYYFIDNKDGKEQIMMPPDPIRAGYIFGSWYKEPDCINKWDFALDTTQETILNENGEVTYQETVLYAGWNPAS